MSENYLNDLYWYAVYVRSRYEKKVYNQLREYEVECFLPLLESVRKWRDRTKRVTQPLFNGYVFVRINQKRDHIKVIDIEGVVRFVGIGRYPSVIIDREIEWLKRLVNEPDAFCGTVPSIPPGMRVIVMAGPFRDFEGVVVKEGHDHRLYVYFESIMQGVEISIRGDLLKPLK